MCSRAGPLRRGAISPRDSGARYKSAGSRERKRRGDNRARGHVRGQTPIFEIVPFGERTCARECRRRFGGQRGAALRAARFNDARPIAACARRGSRGFAEILGRDAENESLGGLELAFVEFFEGLPGYRV